MVFETTESWIVFPIVQTALTLSAGVLIAIYGRRVAKQMGGGILGHAMNFITILAFMLAAFTIFTLFGHLWENVILVAIANFLILFISIGEIVLAYYTKKFAEKIKQMESGV